MIAHLDRFRQIVHFVAVLPIYPHILDAHIAWILGSVHYLQDTRIVDGVFLKGRLQTSLAGAAGMKMRRMRQQRLHPRIGDALAREMGVIECDGQGRRKILQARAPSRAYRQ